MKCDLPSAETDWLKAPSSPITLAAAERKVFPLAVTGTFVADSLPFHSLLSSFHWNACGFQTQERKHARLWLNFPLENRQTAVQKQCWWGEAFLPKRKNPHDKNSSREECCGQLQFSEDFGNEAIWHLVLWWKILVTGERVWLQGPFCFFFFSPSLNFGESENGIFLADISHFPSPLNVLPAPTGSKLAHENVSSSGSAWPSQLLSIPVRVCSSGSDLWSSFYRWNELFNNYLQSVSWIESMTSWNFIVSQNLGMDERKTSFKLSAWNVIIK